MAALTGGPTFPSSLTPSLLPQSSLTPPSLLPHCPPTRSLTYSSRHPYFTALPLPPPLSPAYPPPTLPSIPHSLPLSLPHTLPKKYSLHSSLPPSPAVRCIRLSRRRHSRAPLSASSAALLPQHRRQPVAAPPPPSPFSRHVRAASPAPLPRRPSPKPQSFLLAGFRFFRKVRFG
ncbi:unnamed protein product [Closterium sp. NIES-54]